MPGNRSRLGLGNTARSCTLPVEVSMTPLIDSMRTHAETAAAYLLEDVLLPASAQA